MPTISSGILFDANTFNLKEIALSDIKLEVEDFYVEGEMTVQAFQTIRDQVIFTNKRIMVVNVQGITGKKISYLSYPYSKVQYFGIETAGFLDIDSELILAFSNGAHLQFDFKTQVDIKRICSYISSYVI
ncbi:MAG: PH domain-containing protein [Erysipelotrichaceae bacterium]|nr:PH domain-containing protein [Erysipelotrichaceae bacterium]